MSNTDNLEIFFSEHFQKKLVEYIPNISIVKYAKNILPVIKQCTDNLNSFDKNSLPEEIRDLKVQNVEDISKIRSLKITDFDRLLNNTPALIPLAILILKTNLNLKKLKASNLFIDFMTIDIDKTNLLKKLWEYNLPLEGTFFSDIEYGALALLDKCTYFTPKIQAKYKLFTDLFNAINEALYKPVMRLEDRIVLDINSILDIYMFTGDNSAVFFDGCGPHYSESVEDKLESIMQLNVLKPQKNMKTKLEAKAYISAFNDYQKSKYWYNKIKFFLKYVAKPRCIYKIQNDIMRLNLDNDELLSYTRMLNTLFQCPKYKTSDDDCYERCEEDVVMRSVSTYIFHNYEELYKFLFETYKIRNDKMLAKIIKNYSIKEFSMNFIKWKYDLLKDKTIKTISNQFSNYEQLVKNSLLHDDEEDEFPELERNEDLDDKLYDTYPNTEDLIIEKLEEIYSYFEQFSTKIDDELYDEIAYKIRSLNRFLKSLKKS